MAKYQKYAKYKDSGSQWLGEVPNHWKVEYSKWLFAERNIKATASDEMLTASQKYGVIPQKLFMELEQQKVVQVLSGHDILKKAEANDFVISMRSFQGGIEFSEYSGAVSSAYVPLQPKKGLSLSYYKYLFKSVPYIQSLQTTTNLVRDGQALRYGNFIQVRIPLLPFEEAEKIGQFLDHETAKIDRLIVKQEQLIALLQEKRQAVISHAVTKGLNPDATMKDSGVEWLGQVPKHWECIKIKHITTIFEQGWSPQCDSRPANSSEYGVLKVGCVNGGFFRSYENKALPPELEPRLQYVIQKKDLLISRANTKELVGSAAVVQGDYPNLILCDKLYRLKLCKDVLPEMVALYLSIGVVREQIELGATGASHSMQNIGQETIKELYYLLPPYQEALKILESIQQSNQRFDELATKAQSAIQLMQERRVALISAAVTGKIDVRDWQEPYDAMVS